MGVLARDRLLDLQLNKTDFAEIPPQDARSASERGMRISISQTRRIAGARLQYYRQRTQPQCAYAGSGRQSIDRAAIVNFILQKTGEPAGGLLPQWSSGTAFLFPHCARTQRVPRNFGRKSRLLPS